MSNNAGFLGYLTYIPRAEEDTLFLYFCKPLQAEIGKKTGKSKATTLSFPLSSKKGDIKCHYMTNDNENEAENEK